MDTDNMNEHGEAETDGTFVPPKDGSWVPRTAMNERVESAKAKLGAELQVERDTRIRLEEQVKVLSTQRQAAPIAKIYTLAELRLSVDNGTITQDQADTVYEKQQGDKVDLRVQNALTEFQTTTTETTAVNSGLQGYMELMPDLMKPESEDRKKVTAAYTELTSTFGVPVLGSFEARKIELAALKQCFGPLSALKQRVDNSKQTSEERETHEELGGGGDPPDPKVTNFIKTLGKDRKAYYTKMIEKGQYPGWEAVQEEMKYAK